VKFQHKPEVEDVVKLLKDLGVQIKEKPTRPPTSDLDQRPLSSSHSASVADEFFNARTSPRQQGNNGHASATGFRPIIAVDHFSGGVNASQGDLLQRPRSSLMAPPSRSSASGSGSEMLPHAVSFSSNAMVSEYPRPATSGPSMAATSANLNDLLPPTRELPFKRPSSARNFEPLPTPTLVSEPQSNTEHEAISTSKQTKKRKSTERTNSSFYRSKIASPKGALRLEPTREPYALRSRDVPNTPSSSNYLFTFDAVRGSSPQAPEIARPTANTSNIPRTVDSSYGILDQHAAFLTNPATAPTGALREQSANWAALNPSERLAILDNYFCERLDDEAFVKLCEDVEACWRRIGLGMN